MLKIILFICSIIIILQGTLFEACGQKPIRFLEDNKSSLDGFLVKSASQISNVQPDFFLKFAIDGNLNQWPTIHGNYKIFCNGNTANTSDSVYFRLYENDNEITDFTLWCPDSTPSCASSVSLVLDASYSMSGSNTFNLKAAVNAYIDLMDGIIDEANIIWFTSFVNVELGMTTNKTDLREALSHLPANGGSAIWEGIYVGLQELILSGSNPCRALIAIADGYDNGSTHTPDEVIALANQNKIRVYTIGLSATDTTQLQRISLLTGGQYTYSSTPSYLWEVYQKYMIEFHSSFNECRISYQSQCADGARREVKLEVINYCTGQTTFQTRSFNAPLDTSTFTNVELELDSASGRPGEDVVVPLNLLPPIGPMTNFQTAIFQVLFDTSCVKFKDIVALAGTLLEGLSFNVTPIQGGIQISTSDNTVVQGNGRLANLTFTIADGPSKSSCSIELRNWVFSSGCLIPFTHDGVITILPDNDTPQIVVEGSTTICDGDSVVLRCSDGFSEYLWSTGATTQSIIVTTSGSFTVQAKNQKGQTQTSATVNITVSPKPTPSITPSGSQIICAGQNLKLDVTNTFSEYKWSNGAIGKFIYVQSTGIYFVDVRSSAGCWGRSNTVTVTEVPAPSPDIQGQDQVCPGATAFYDVTDVAGHQYKWNISGGGILSGQGSNHVEVLWGYDRNASVTVEQTDPSTGCSNSDVFSVSIPDIHPQVSYNNTLNLCDGETVILTMPAGYDSYTWNTGMKNRSLTVTSSGDYYCFVTSGACNGSSDTVVVTVTDLPKPDISGSIVVCKNSTSRYSITPVTGSQYQWAVSGGNILTGQGTGSIEVQWGSGANGNVYSTVTLGECRQHDTLVTTISSTIKPTITVLGRTEICQGETVTLDAGAGYATYDWSNGQKTRTINVAMAGSYSVFVTQDGGCQGSSDPVTISVYPQPMQPVITKNGNVLTCTKAESYQWYMDGSKLPGETNQFVVIQSSGVYTVVITDEHGCMATATPLTVSSTERYSPALAKRLDIAPNPNSGLFTITVEFDKPTAFAYRVVDIAGKTLQTVQESQPVVQYQHSLNLVDAPAGLYLLVLESREGFDYRKIIIN